MSAVEQIREPGPDATDLPEPAAPADDPLPDDEVFHLLQCRRRRDALRYLFAQAAEERADEDGADEDGLDRQEPVRMRDLAEQVAAWEHETTVAALSSKQRQRVYIPLYQTHLPKLDEARVIEYDQHRGRVGLGPRATQLLPYLDVEPSDESVGEDESREAVGEVAAEDSGARRWARYYLGALGLSAVVLGGAALGVPPFGSLRWGVVAALIALLFAAVSIGDPTTGSVPPE